MKRLIPACFLFFYSTNILAQNRLTLFDGGWKFYKGGVQGGQNIDFDDTRWRSIDLPHDWSIEDLPTTQSPFNKDAISQVGGGFTTGGTAWYRKHFIVDSKDKNKILNVQFDGVYMNADVWINGEFLGNHPYGYTGFIYNISDKIKFDSDNVIAVEVKNEGQNSRWYSGSGIYRHVWLQILSPIHIGQWGTYITTSEISPSSAKININIQVINEMKDGETITVRTKILNHKGLEVANQTSTQAVSNGNSYEFQNAIILKDPQMWSIENPVQYTEITEVYQNEKLTDIKKTKFGIRKISFDTVNGFQLNEKNIKLKGACFHNDNGPLGSKAYDRAEVRKVELLKASGFNAIRCSHNPPSPAFLNACDSLGMLVMDEAFDAWNIGKMPYDYHLYFKDWWRSDIAAMVMRDRNHPCIIMWSIGNEIPERDTPEGDSTAFRLARLVHSLDPTRPVTSAVNSVSEKADPFFEALDIAGYNYSMANYEIDHNRKPGRVMVGTESFPLEAFDYWMGVVDHPWVIGDFVWTGFDYIGEASIGWRGYEQEKNFYHWNIAYCGDIDICGWKRPQSYYRDVLWKPNQLSIFVRPPQPSFPINPKREPWSKWHWQDVVADWNWSSRTPSDKGHENELMYVSVYSSCSGVELFINGQSLGKKKTNRSDQFIANWQVPYRPGELKAIGYNEKGVKINSTELHTAGKPMKIKLVADRTTIDANNEDLSYITVELVDDHGYLNPNAENLLQFEITGPGTIAGVGNGNPMSIESFQQPHRKAWRGKCLMIVKSGKTPGYIVLKVSSPGITGSVIRLKSVNSGE
jgi:beta-galactosidase